MRPDGTPPMVTSKKTTGFGILSDSIVARNYNVHKMFEDETRETSDASAIYQPFFIFFV